MIQYLNYYFPNTLAVHLRTWTRKINHGMLENRLPTSIKQGHSLNQPSWDVAMQVRCLQIPEMSPTLHTVPENLEAPKRTEIYWPCKPPYNSWWWASSSKLAKLFISVGRERKSYNFSREKVPMSQEEAFARRPPPPSPPNASSSSSSPPAVARFDIFGFQPPATISYGLFHLSFHCQHLVRRNALLSLHFWVGVQAPWGLRVLTRLHLPLPIVWRLRTGARVLITPPLHRHFSKPKVLCDDDACSLRV